MSSSQITTSTAIGTPEVEPGDMSLEVVVVPVSDVDRAKEFYATRLGFRLHADFTAPDGLRIVQVTPPGSRCSINFGTQVTSATPGSAQGMIFVVRDIDATRSQPGQPGCRRERGVPRRRWCLSPRRNRRAPTRPST